MSLCLSAAGLSSLRENATLILIGHVALFQESCVGGLRFPSYSGERSTQSTPVHN